MEVEQTGRSAGFDWWAGRVAGRDCVLARCGMGKVAAAAAAQRLIDQWQASGIVVCGLAGGLREGLEVGDIVVGERFVQHDLDASPIFPRFEVPGLGMVFFEAAEALVAAAVASSEVAARAVLPSNEAWMRQARLPSVHRGLVVTGDQFIKDDKRLDLLRDFPDALCVEMEGGAIAQVCHLNDVPFVIVRIISDNSDHSAPVDFTVFAEQIAPTYTVAIVPELLSRLAEDGE
jgi:adenosylhomocysteine nucleosidase